MRTWPPMRAEDFPPPIGMTLRRGPRGELIVVQRWWPSFIRLAVFATWAFTALALPLVWIAESGVTATVLRNTAAWIPAALLVGYAPIAMVFNKTTYTMFGATLTVQKGPLWWPKRRQSISLGESYCFEVRKRPSLGRDPTWELIGITRDGRELRVTRFNVNLMLNVTALCRILERHVHETRAATR